MAYYGGEAFEYSIDSAIRGYHVYKNIWIPEIGEGLQLSQENGNEADQFAGATYKEEAVVGHVPREISRICWYFLEHDGEILCEVNGNKQRSPLAQGGLEIPCKLTFIGKPKLIKKLKKLLK